MCRLIKSNDLSASDISASYPTICTSAETDQAVCSQGIVEVTPSETDLLSMQLNCCIFDQVSLCGHAVQKLKREKLVF